MVPLLALAPADAETLLHPGAIAVYLLLTAAFLAVAFVILWKVSSYEAKLILLGLLVVVVALGYGAFLAPIQDLARSLVKVGVILVLGGIAISVLSYLRGAAGETPRPAQTAIPEGPPHES
jgi:hypothetical protein